MSYTTRELTAEEAEIITKEIQDVLAKHDCEIGVKAAIEILKREEVKEFITQDGNNKEITEANTEA